MKASRYLRAILSILLWWLVYMLIVPPIQNSSLHCWWNTWWIYLKCAGENEMDLLMIKYDNDYR